ncbi:Uncharacterized protein ChrSV_3665 [Chromobacterium vaccinii]|nr:Uncharacterized protein ChrSW_3665 [Chromobacterium vaccinii]QND91122.1 Uncharacterized protein ChrSV_3665 [Chromobacterium vaccinii]
MHGQFATTTRRRQFNHQHSLRSHPQNLSMIRKNWHKEQVYFVQKSLRFLSNAWSK